MIRLFDAGNPTRVYIGTDTRASSLLLGALFAVAPLRMAMNRFTARVGGGYNAFAVAVIAAIGVSWAVADGPGSPWLFRGGLFAHSLLSAVIVAGSAAQPNAVISRLIGWEPLRITGVLSYSLYLWHWPLYALLSESRTGMSGWGLFAVRVGASFVAAALSKVLVEDPVRFRAAWAHGRAGLMALIGVTVAVALFWVVIPHPNTEAAQFSIDQLTSTTHLPSTTTVPAPTTTRPAVVSPVPTSASVPTTTLAPTTMTTLMAPTQRVIMTGDSLAFDEWPGVAAAMYASKIAIGSYVSPGAGLLDTKYPSLEEIEKAITSFHPDLVLYQGSLWDFGSPDQQRAAYESFTDFVLASGARLGFITIPPLRADQHNDQLTPLTGLMNEIADAHPGTVFVLDSTGAWGPVFAQDVNGDKIPERKPDGAHVCPSGSAMYALWLTSELQQRFADFTPAPATAWATGPWVDDPRYTNPAGICAKLD
jgi:hypothetical protein